MYDGRKIDRYLENPVDNIIIDIANALNRHLFRPLNFTPNMITTLSLVIGLSSSLFFYKEQYLISIVTFTVAYILDCADGNYARMYNMVTRFGDFYDHICDVVKFVPIMIIIYIHPIPSMTKILFFSLFFTFMIMTSIHIGCQEKNYKDSQDMSIKWTKKLCCDDNDIIWTRYFGLGTTISFTVLFMLYVWCVRY